MALLVVLPKNQQILHSSGNKFDYRCKMLTRPKRKQKGRSVKLIGNKQGSKRVWNSNDVEVIIERLFVLNV